MTDAGDNPLCEICCDINTKAVTPQFESVHRHQEAALSMAVDKTQLNRVLTKGLC